MDQLGASITTLEEEIKELNAEVEEDLKQMKKAGEDRDAANAEFQATIADQRATQKLLDRAITVLERHYTADKSALDKEKFKMEITVGDKSTEDMGLIQAPKLGSAPPEGFKTYKDNESGHGVLGMLNKINADARVMEQECLDDEKAAQDTYEKIVQQTNETVDKKRKDVVNKTQQKARNDKDKMETKSQVKDASDGLEMLSNQNVDLHADCDFIMKNFEVRQTAIDQEMEALAQAKAVLSGADFGKKKGEA